MRLLFISFLFLSITAYSQTLPDSLKVDWNNAGMPDFVTPSIMVNVTDFGATGDGVTDEMSIIMRR